MDCKHHPDYDPASGEPFGKLTVDTHRVKEYVMGSVKKATTQYFEEHPCPYCWQARAKWLEGARYELLEEKRAHSRAGEAVG